MESTPPSPLEPPITGPEWVVYRPRRTLSWAYVERLWSRRALLYFLVSRDIKVQYKQTYLGPAWPVIHPLLTVAFYTILLGRVAGLPTEDGIPYGLYCFAGMLPWHYFSSALAGATNSLVANAALLRKASLPTLFLPCSGLVPPLVGFGLASVLLLAFTVWAGQPTAAPVLLVPVFLLLAALTALATALWLAALSVRYRDVQQLLPFLVQTWMFASPVVYAPTLVPEGVWRSAYYLNPLAVVIHGLRWGFLGTPAPTSSHVWALGLVVGAAWTGLIYFHRMEPTFADEV